MEGWRGLTTRELGMYALAAVAVLGTLTLPFAGPLFGVALALLGYSEHGYDTEAAETGWQLVVVGAGLAAVGVAYTVFVVVT